MSDSEIFEEDLSEIPNFSNVSDELVFWKARSSKLQQALRETQNSLTEYQVESKEYETELENSLEVYDSQNLELKRTVDILQLENEHWKKKFADAQLDHNTALESLQREVAHLRNMHQQTVEQARNLEQDNDDLERSGRAAESSLRDMENRLAQLTEKNQYLEKELEIKKRLVIVAQRLKEELRDVNLELKVLKSKAVEPQLPATPPASPPAPLPSSPQPPAERNIKYSKSTDFSKKVAVEVSGRRSSSISLAEPKTPPVPPLPSLQQQQHVEIVKSMLGKVQNLEGRLMQCKENIKPMLIKRSDSGFGATTDTRIPLPRHRVKSDASDNPPSLISDSTTLLNHSSIAKPNETRPGRLENSKLQERVLLRKTRLQEIEIARQKTIKQNNSLLLKPKVRTPTTTGIPSVTSTTTRRV